MPSKCKHPHEYNNCYKTEASCKSVCVDPNPNDKPQWACDPVSNSCFLTDYCGDAGPGVKCYADQTTCEKTCGSS